MQNSPTFKFQFGISQLLIVLLIVAVTLAFLSKENLPVTCATLFCSMSWTGIFVGCVISIANLIRTVSRAYQHRKLSLLSPRLKWLMVDGLILIWGFVSIASANFVLANYAYGAKWLLLLTLYCSPVFGTLILMQARRTSGSETQPE